MSGNLSFLLLPATCLLCLEPGTNNNDLCQDCCAELPWISFACQHCGIPLDGNLSQAHLLPNTALNQPDSRCADCLRKPPPFTQCIAPLLYATPVDRLVHGFKQGNRLFGQVLARAIGPQLWHTRTPDLLAPVPLHRNRRRARGFNQARLICDALSRQFHVPIETNLCRRILDTPAQRLLGRNERQRNLRGAFVISGNVRDKHIGLVDDVVTTGATVSEVTRTLMAAGAASVTVFALARTPATRLDDPAQ